MNSPLEIIKAKLARGGQVNGGEIRLILLDYTKVVEQLQERVDELEKKLNAKSRGSNSGSKKPDKPSDV